MATETAIAYEKVVVSADEMTLSKIVWRRFGVWKPGLVERILDRQGELAETIYLPIGAVVEIPIDPPSLGPSTERQVIQLWD